MCCDLLAAPEVSRPPDPEPTDLQTASSVNGRPTLTCRNSDEVSPSNLGGPPVSGQGNIDDIDPATQLRPLLERHQGAR